MALKEIDRQRVPNPRFIEPIREITRISKNTGILKVGQSIIIKSTFSSNEKERPQVKSSSTQSKKEHLIDEYGVAVILGNKNYSKNSDIPDVDFAHNDAEAIYDHVINELGFKEGNVILVKDASQSDFVSIFGNEKNHQGKLYNWIRPRLSNVFVYYSGHGAPSLKDGKGYLLPVDADPSIIELNGYSLETMYGNLGKIPAKSITVILDACFSGGSADGTLVKNASSISLKRVEVKEKTNGFSIFTASGLSEVASWDKENKHGLFTSFFLKGISGSADADLGNKDGKVTIGEMKNYLSNEVTYWARRKYNREQHPEIIGNSEIVMSTID